MITGWKQRSLEKRRTKDITCRVETPIQWEMMSCSVSCTAEDANWWCGTGRSATWQHAHTGQQNDTEESLLHARRTWEEIQWERWVGWGYSLRCVAAEQPADETCYVHAEIWPSPRSPGLSWWETSLASQTGCASLFLRAFMWTRVWGDIPMCYAGFQRHFKNKSNNWCKIWPLHESNHDMTDKRHWNGADRWSNV